jgi:hypothetical protein
VVLEVEGIDNQFGMSGDEVADREVRASRALGAPTHRALIHGGLEIVYYVLADEIVNINRAVIELSQDGHGWREIKTAYLDGKDKHSCDVFETVLVGEGILGGGIQWTVEFTKEIEVGWSD